MQSKAFIYSIIIVLVTILAGFFILPQGFDQRFEFQRWRLGLDLTGGSHLVYEVDLSKVKGVDQTIVLDGLRDVIEKRVNLFGVSEPQVYLSKSGDSQRLIVELAGVKDVKEAIKQIGLTPLLYFAEITTPLEEGGEAQYVPTELTGRYISGAQLTFDQVTRSPQISLSFNKEGSKLFADVTGRNVGKPVAVFLDNNLITAPVVQERIAGGQAQITGQFSIQEAKELVGRFNAGALPAPINLINQQTIGASLGADSLQKTLYAGLVGTLILIAFMILYYKGFGFVASLALLVYMIITLAIFKLFGITLTLAGIAGFILSIGMAVDANILIFERTKEEIKKGSSKTTAISEGFKRAWPSIRDSNVTTIITAVILYYFTSGFVQGFALALLVGVVVSMFSAITVTRSFLNTIIKDHA
ncbi:TPA: protein translocase subunit SecD [Patescibacteria group bacterium]|nr:protein translocase subunit SecD [Patescibacteria group bacterium]|tara:strand:+ start:5466 stop:6710 length:1245 start_codon:yes stop_codon:yes gene_type:complete